MIRWQNILNYYLDSERFFQIYLNIFLDEFNHMGDMIMNGKVFDFETAVAHNIYQKLNCNDGYFDLKLPSQKIKEYFSFNFTESQLFSVIFGCWYGLPEEQIEVIKNGARESICWVLLNCFLSGMTVETALCILNNTSKVNDRFDDFYKYKYKGIYYLTPNGGQTEEIYLSQPPHRIDQ